MIDQWVRIALVTGANRGIGFEVCRQLASEGFVVVLTARDAAKAESAAAKLWDVGTVQPVGLDVTDPPGIERAAEMVADRYGYLEVLVNSAGINYDTWEAVEDADIEEVTETQCKQLLKGVGVDWYATFKANSGELEDGNQEKWLATFEQRTRGVFHRGRAH